MRRRLREVTEGQWFRKRSPGGGTWEVVAIRRDAIGALHAQIRRADDRSTYKTLAAVALLNHHEYELVDNPNV
jgi:hypothetical protein